MSKQTHGPRSADPFDVEQVTDPAHVHPIWEARTPPTLPSDDPASPTEVRRPDAVQPVAARPGQLETLLFRFVLLYIGIQLLPIDVRFFQNLFSLDGGYTRWLFNLSKYAPRFFGPADTFANWGIVALLAVVGTAIWTARNHRRSEGHLPSDSATDLDQTVYGWLRVAVRYRLALAVIAYGFLKLFAIQAPMPSISNLNTAYGDHSAWKLFSLSLGIVPGYQSFLGAVELLGGLLLLNRKTTVVGTLILLPFLGNVFFSNVAYEGGEYVYSGLLITFGLFLFAHDAVRLFRLVSLEAPVQPDRSFLPLTKGSGAVAPAHRFRQTARLVLKGGFVLLAVLLYGFTTATTGSKAERGPARFPQTAGLPGLGGIYRVTEFRQNGQLIPYSKTHRTRWQDVVFETWNTLSIRSNAPVNMHHVDTEELPADDIGRDYELAGSQGRHYYRYTADADGRTLTLQNANPNHATDRLTGTPVRLSLTRRNDSTLVLTGLTADRDSVYALLTKLNKKYLLHEAAKAGRRGSLTL